jgi:hypothetical protein
MKKSSADSAVTLPCKQCGYVNEPERVYCHNCGSKLDRSVLPKEDQVNRESPEKARRRIQKMTNPGKDYVKREIKAFVSTMFWSVVVAALIQMARPPDGVPASKQGLLNHLIGSELIESLESPTPRRLVYTEADINMYLASSLRNAKDDSFINSIIEFKRAYVNLTPDVCHIGMEKSLWGYPIFFVADYRLEVIAGNFTATNVGGSIGRMQVHPMLMKYADTVFGGLWTALHREEQEMHKMQTVQVEKGQITLITQGTGKK